MDFVTPYKSKLHGMDASTSYKSKLRGYCCSDDAPASSSSTSEMKYASSGRINKATIKYEKAADFKTPMPKSAKMSQPFTPPPAPRANRSIVEVMEIDSPQNSSSINNNNFDERTPKRRSLRKSRLSEVAPISGTNGGGGIKAKSTQTKKMDAEIAKLEAENRALNQSIAEKREEIAKMKRRSQSFVDTLRSMAQNFSFDEN